MSVSDFINKIFELGDNEVAISRANEIIEEHLAEESEELVSNQNFRYQKSEYSHDMFDNMQSKCLRTLESDYEDFKLSSNYFNLYGVLNLEVKQYIVLRKAGLIPSL